MTVKNNSKRLRSLSFRSRVLGGRRQLSSKRGSTFWRSSYRSFGMILSLKDGSTLAISQKFQILNRQWTYWEDKYWIVLLWKLNSCRGCVIVKLTELLPVLVSLSHSMSLLLDIIQHYILLSFFPSGVPYCVGRWVWMCAIHFCILYYYIIAY